MSSIRDDRPRPPRRDVAVESRQQLTPQLVRIVATGELARWPTGAPGGHFKVFIPQADGEAAMRTYTVRAYDPAAGRLTVDFALHADGPATAFARSARPGDRFQISGISRPGYEPSEGSRWTVLIADQSALPAVAAIAESLPAGYRALALVEVPAAAEQLELSSAAELELRWLTEEGAPCAQLVAAARALELPQGAGEVWVGAEADAMRAIRRDLLHDRGLHPRSIRTRAYWRNGAVNYTDHDLGEDVD